MKIQLTFLTAFIFFSSCNNDNESNEPCIGNQICTTERINITVSVVDLEGDPVILDDYYTFIDSRTRIEPDSSIQQVTEGVYPVASDANMDLIAYEGTTVVFVGVLEGENVIENTMVIEKDCCHISLLRGETELILELE